MLPSHADLIEHHVVVYDDLKVWWNFSIQQKSVFDWKEQFTKIKIGGRKA